MVYKLVYILSQTFISLQNLLFHHTINILPNVVLRFTADIYIDLANQYEFCYQSFISHRQMIALMLSYIISN